MLNENAGVQASSSRQPPLPGAGGGLPIQYRHPDDRRPAELYEVAEQAGAKATASGKFIVVQNSICSSNTPQRADQRSTATAAALGVAVDDDRHARWRARRRRARSRKFDRDNRSYDVDQPRCAQTRPPQPGATSAQSIVRAATARWCRCPARRCASRPTRARGDRAVQPAELGDAVGAAAARRHDVRGAWRPCDRSPRR